jgi:hypothetical protein
MQKEYKRGFYWVKRKEQGPEYLFTVGFYNKYCDMWMIIGSDEPYNTDDLTIGDFIAEKYIPKSELSANPAYD